MITLLREIEISHLETVAILGIQHNWSPIRQQNYKNFLVANNMIHERTLNEQQLQEGRDAA